jgi:hypothetical protein
MKTIDFSRNSDNQMVVVVNSTPPRTLYNANNLTIKPITNGAVVKLTDETWRQRVFLDDVVTEAGVAKSPFADQTALITYLTGFFHN